MTVLDIYHLIDAVAPFDTQMEGDNSGILVGSPSAPVSGILFALDATEAVIEEAKSLGATLIVTHHPLMFAPRRSLTDGDYEGRLISMMIREGISMIAAHTNLDQAQGGMNDVLAALCGLEDVSGEGFLRTGTLPQPLTAAQYAEELQNVLGDAVRVMGPADAVVRKVGLCSGGGSDQWTRAADAGCDAFVSGEIKHHHALAMAGAGLVGFECGHHATENPGIRALAEALQMALDHVKCNVRVFESVSPAYSFSRQP